LNLRSNFGGCRQVCTGWGLAFYFHKPGVFTLYLMTHKEKWLLFAPIGLLTIGAGASMVDWAGSLKTKGKPAGTWVLAGTAALVVFNAGMSLFGRGVVEKTLYEVREKVPKAAAAN
jgi:hypothetical protein